jgi:ribosomal protein S27AE
MKLTKKQADKIVGELNKFIPHFCPICHSGEMSINENIFEMREFNGGNLILGGQSAVFPVIPLSCGKCGHTIFFNAVLLGILNKEGKNIDD